MQQRVDARRPDADAFRVVRDGLLDGLEERTRAARIHRRVLADPGRERGDVEAVALVGCMDPHALGMRAAELVDERHGAP